MDELKNCPFCGGTAELVHNRTFDFWVRCIRCHARTRQHHENENGAAHDWNERVLPFSRCATCAHLTDMDGGFFCAKVHQVRSQDDFCSRWTERSW